MQPTETAAWQCTVCGYIHHGPEPPDECPVCGVSSDEFEPHAEEVQVAPAAAPRRWRCLICDYVHEGDEPPDECPICAAGADQFEPIEEETAST
ncbi:MAG: pyridine nucleotide-disulfide oxidoreductase, partial [Gemmatimonadetes bacterium]|nr:pyridine nucleotide-disulfide oxidoreductase [Gemmatimonadota bacterium]